MNPFMCRREAWLELTALVSPVGVGRGEVHDRLFIIGRELILLLFVWLNIRYNHYMVK